MNKLNNCLVLLFVLAVSGCATKEYKTPSGTAVPPSLGIAVETLEVSKDLYTAALGLAGALHCDKKITDATALKIINAADKYYLAHKSAVLAVRAWQAAYDVMGVDPVAAKTDAIPKLIQIGTEAAALVSEIKELTGRKLPVPEALEPNTLQARF